MVRNACSDSDLRSQKLERRGWQCVCVGPLGVRTHWCTHAPEPRLWLLQISGVHAPQPVSSQHHDPLWRHSLEASILGVPRHAALGDGETPVWLALPAPERKPSPGLREPARPGCQSWRLPDVGLAAPPGQEFSLSHAKLEVSFRFLVTAFPFYLLLFLKKRFYLFIFRRGKGGGEAEKHQCVVASHMPPTGGLAGNPGVSPDWESNQGSFGSQARTQSAEPHQPEPFLPLDVC